MSELDRLPLSPFRQAELDGLLAAREAIDERFASGQGDEDLLYHRSLCHNIIKHIIFHTPHPPILYTPGQPLKLEPDPTRTLLALYSPEHLEPVADAYSEHIRQLHIN